MRHADLISALVPLVFAIDSVLMPLVSAQVPLVSAQKWLIIQADTGMELRIWVQWSVSAKMWL